MDLKVCVEGIIREVGGVNESTTCEEIIIKLAQASNLPGFYTLVAIYRGKEDTLSAEAKILDFVRKTKENPNAIKFILRRLEAPPRSSYSRLAASNLAPGTQTRPVNLFGTSDSGSAGMRGSELLRSTLESKQSSSQSGLPRTVVEQDEYEQLEDRLAFQEREVELNRNRLFQLDKDIAELERANRVNGCLESVAGPAAELAQLSATPWSQLLEANRARQMDLLKERDKYQQALERVDRELETAQQNVAELDSKVSEGLDRLLVTLDAANCQRRRFLRSLSPTSVRPRPSTKTDGVPV